jgi:hypothetical protein
VILLQIESQNETILPFECQAPWTIDMDRITLRTTMESMKIESGLAQRIEGGGCIDCVEPNEGALLQIGSDPSGFTRLEQLFQAAVPEVPDYNSCKQAAAGP